MTVPLRALLAAGCVAAALGGAEASARGPLGNPWPPAGWRRLAAPVAGDAELRFLVGLRNSNLDRVERAFWGVADPESPEYGRFWTKSMVDEAVRPPAVAVAKVKAWLSTFASSLRATSAEDWFEVRATASAVRRAFGTEVGLFEHAPTGKRVLRTHGWAPLPHDVSDVIDVVHGLSELVDPRASGRRSAHHGTRRAPLMTAHKVGDAQRRAGVVLRGGRADPAPAPYVGLVMSANRGFILSVDPICPTSAYGCNVTELPQLVASLEVRLEPVRSGAQPLREHFPVKDAQCYPYYEQGGPVQCTLVLSGAVNFKAYNISVLTHFTSGKVSGPGVSPAVVYSSPWALPSTIRALYNASDVVATNANASVGVALFEYQYYSPKDEAAFVQLSGSSKARAPVVVAPTDPNDPSSPGDEGQMDIELTSTVAAGAAPTYWYASDNSTGLLDWAVQVNNATAPPLVFSISWGLPESAIASALGPHFEARLNAELMKMGLRGVTAVFASGDAGATNIGRGIDNCDRLQPSFPASSPYVVSVSATMLLSGTPGAHSLPSWPNSTEPICGGTLDGQPVSCAGSATPVQEVAVSCCSALNGASWTTGGGFSDHYPRPSFQDAAVAAYLKDPQVQRSLPPAGIWNATGRAYPDVSAIGQNLLLYIFGQLNDNGGTSASTPIVAGLLALVNDARLNAGKPPLGPAAPWLYAQWAKNPAAFNDIIVGNNACGEMECCPHGFDAHLGWDPVTGLGTLNLGLLRQAVADAARNA